MYVRIYTLDSRKLRFVAVVVVFVVMLVVLAIVAAVVVVVVKRPPTYSINTIQRYTFLLFCVLRSSSPYSAPRRASRHAKLRHAKPSHYTATHTHTTTTTTRHNSARC